MAAARSPRARAQAVRRAILCVGGLALAGGLACKAAPRDLVSPSEQAAPAEAGGDAAYDLEEQAPGDVDLAGSVGEATPEPTRRDDDLAGDLATYERLLVEQELRLRSAGVDLEGTVAVADASNAGGGRTKSAGDAVGGVIVPKEDSPKPSTPGKAATSTSPSKKSSKAKRPSAGGYGAGSGAGMGRAPEAEPVAPAQEDRCATICDLAAATCDLQDRICDLADRHPGEERYSQVCARATSDCERARQACQECPV
ncbi:MAG: hypothetical protein KC486_29495 [Myxococcales bacterium]|nr:hypothetical protein [Myxococcales bacterium]